MREILRIRLTLVFALFIVVCLLWLTEVRFAGGDKALPTEMDDGSNQTCFDCVDRCMGITILDSCEFVCGDDCGVGYNGTLRH